MRRCVDKSLLGTINVTGPISYLEVLVAAEVCKLAKSANDPTSHLPALHEARLNAPKWGEDKNEKPRG